LNAENIMNHLAQLRLLTFDLLGVTGIGVLSNPMYLLFYTSNLFKSILDFSPLNFNPVFLLEQ